MNTHDRFTQRTAFLILAKGFYCVFTFLFLAASVSADTHFNSSEPGCDGTQILTSHAELLTPRNSQPHRRGSQVLLLRVQLSPADLVVSTHTD